MDSKRDNIVELTIEYFVKQGFKLVNDNPKNLEFKRGSILLNHFTFNPLKWKSQIDVKINNNIVKATFKIDTTGQTAIKSELKAWEHFIENYKLSLIDGNQNIKSNIKKRLLVHLGQLKYLFFVLIIALLIGAVQGSISGAIYWLFKLFD